MKIATVVAATMVLSIVFAILGKFYQSNDFILASGISLGMGIGFFLADKFASLFIRDKSE